MLLAYRLQNFPANENQGPVPEEIYQTLLTIRKPWNELGQDLSIQGHNSPIHLGTQSLFILFLDMKEENLKEEKGQTEKFFL